MYFSRSRQWSALAIVGVAALSVYRVTLAPGLTWSHAGTDGGDLVTAAAVWGVPHPPGYPTYIALGHVFASLPFGSVAFNLNLMSAVSAAFASVLVAASVLRSAPSSRRAAPLAASVAGLTLALSPMLWGQATIAEVHALNACFVAALVFLTSPWRLSSSALSNVQCGALGLVWGLGLGNSLTLVALAPMILPVLWRSRSGRRMGFAAFAVGICVYFLIPIRASTQPSINWGNAQDLSGVAWLVSGGLYRGYVLSAAPDLIIQRVLSLPRLWLEQMGWIGALWVGWGLATQQARRSFVPVGTAIALYAAFAVSYNTSDSNLYLIPIWVLSASYLGVDLGALLEAQTRRVWRAVLVCMASLGVVVLLIAGWSTHDLSGDRTASEFAERLLTTLPADAILVTHADAHTFTLWYHVQVLGQRRDIAIVDARLAGYDWYEPMLAAQGAVLVLPPEPAVTDFARWLAAAYPTRPVCDLTVESEQDICRWQP